jgi:G-patch domain
LCYQPHNRKTTSLVLVYRRVLVFDKWAMGLQRQPLVNFLRPTTTVNMGDVVRARSKEQSAAIGTGSTDALEPASSSSSFAQRQLEKMGWSAGTGLGKKRNGVTTHIVIQKREESVGLGSDKEAAAIKIREQSSEWWKDALGDTLAKLGGSADKKTSSKRKSSSSKRKAVTDADLFQATGGARFGMRAGKTRNLAKWRRTETNDNDDDAPVVVMVDAKIAADDSPTKQRSTKESSDGDLGDSLKGGKSKKDRVAKRDKKKKSKLEKNAKPAS